jgi:hypothetical protein
VYGSECRLASLVFGEGLVYAAKAVESVSQETVQAGTIELVEEGIGQHLLEPPHRWSKILEFDLGAGQGGDRGGLK